MDMIAGSSAPVECVERLAEKGPYQCSRGKKPFGVFHPFSRHRLAISSRVTRLYTTSALFSSKILDAW